MRFMAKHHLWLRELLESTIATMHFQKPEPKITILSACISEAAEQSGPECPMTGFAKDARLSRPRFPAVLPLLAIEALQ